MKNRPRAPVFQRFLPARYRRRVARVDIPQEAFLAVLKVTAGANSEE